MKDKSEGLRNFAVGKLDLKKEDVKKAVEPILIDLAKNDPNRPVKAAAITKLGQYKNPAYVLYSKLSE